MFSGVAFSNDKIFIFNDPIGLWHLYYCVSENLIIVSTNLNSIKQITKNEIRISSLVLEATSGEFCQYGNTTVLQNVFSLFPGECKIIENDTNYSLFDTTIKQDDKVAEKGFVKELVEFMDNKISSFFEFENDSLLSLSGGVDSRVNLALLLPLNKHLRLINYGRNGLIDTQIPIAISKKINCEIDIVDPTPYSFPDFDVVRKAFVETDSIYINSWFAILNRSQFYGKYKTLLLGDMCDILRSKGISSIKTRSFRVKFFLARFFFGQKLKLDIISDDNLSRFKREKEMKLLSDADSAMDFLKIKLEDRDAIRTEIKRDLCLLFEHLSKYKFSTIQSYEELFGIFTHGRKSMGKQLNLCKIAFCPFIPLLNLQIIRKVLNYSPASRYGDELTNEMFKTLSWRTIGDLPTAQNPFSSYNSNYFVMLLGWFLRSILDQVFLRIYVLTSGKSKRKRLFPTFDAQPTYTFPGNYAKFLSYFNSKTDSTKVINIFEGRMKNKLWPLPGMDLMPFVQTSLYRTLFDK